jgi:hypothetical protein
VEQYRTAGQATDYNTIWRMRVAWWIPKATDTHSEYLIRIAFPLQQWLGECGSLLRAMWIIVTCNVGHCYMQCGSLLRAMWVIVTCNVGYCYVQCGSLFRAMWVIVTCNVGHCYVQCGSLLRAMWVIVTCNARIVIFRIA